MGEGLCGMCEVTARVGWAEAVGEGLCGTCEVTAHLGGHRAAAAHISAPWQSWRSHSWFVQRYHVHSLQRRRPQSSPAQGRLPGLPCGWVFVSLYHAHNLSKAVQEGHRWQICSPQTPRPAGTNAGGIKWRYCLPVKVQGTIVFGLIDILEELWRLVL